MKLEAVPFTPMALGVMVVVPAARALIWMLAASCPAGMYAGLGETAAMPAVPKLKVTYVPPAGDGSESRTCVLVMSVALIA